MFQRKVLEPRSFETDVSGPSLEALEEAPRRRAYGNRQHQLMVGSLLLLLIALGLLIYNDRDFWFPDTLEADDTLPGPTTVSAASLNAASVSAGTTGTSGAGAKSGTSQPVIDAGRVTGKRSGSRAQTKDASAPDPPPVTEVRTVLPPLQIEVVAGNVHNAVHPGTNSVHVDLQPGDLQSASLAPNVVHSPSTAEADTASAVTSNVAENVQMSGTSEMVSRSVAPNYPLLARQMKVQGSVILQALINRDGSIQDLRIVSGPPILASAAREAVRQWHFKPRYQGVEAIETLARITVNFTISTN